MQQRIVFRHFRSLRCIRSTITVSFSGMYSLSGLPTGTYYTWQIDGPNDPISTGRRFYPHKELLDPWARAVSDRLWDRRHGIDPNAKGGGLRAIVVNSLSPSVPATTALQTGPDLTGAVIYELHVGAFTRHPSAGVSQPGLFAGLHRKNSLFEGTRHYPCRIPANHGI